MQGYATMKILDFYWLAVSKNSPADVAAKAHLSSSKSIDLSTDPGLMSHLII
jgi:hypothetical protein